MSIQIPLICFKNVTFNRFSFDVKYAWIISWLIRLNGLTSDLQIGAVYDPYMEELAIPSVKRTDQR